MYDVEILHKLSVCAKGQADEEKLRLLTEKIRAIKGIAPFEYPAHVLL